MNDVKSVAEINQYVGTSVNPLETPDTVYELYSVPSFDGQYPEIIKGANIGSTKVTVEAGDVLVCKINPRINRVWVVKHHTEHQLLASSEWIVIRNHDIDSDYLKWYFSSPTFRELLTSQVAGIGGSLTRAQPKQVAKYPVPVPAISVQRHIATVLNKVNDLIILRKQVLAKLDELVKARFFEMFGDTILNPFGWKKDLLGTVCDVRDGTHDSPQYFESGYPLVTSKNVTGGKIDLTDCSLICEADFKKINERSKVDIGDIIMPMIGTVGKPVIVDIEPNFAIKNVSLIKFKADSRVLNIYIRALLQSDYFDDAVLSKVRGGTQKFISLGDIRKLEVLVPPMELQEQFATFIKQTDKSKVAVQKALDEAQLLFDSLMQKYFG